MTIDFVFILQCYYENFQINLFFQSDNKEIKELEVFFFYFNSRFYKISKEFKAFQIFNVYSVILITCYIGKNQITKIFFILNYRSTLQAFILSKQNTCKNTIITT